MFVKLQNKKCIVLGGGQVAERKICLLLEAGGQVVLISPEITEKLKSLVINNKIEYLNRKYKKGDLKGAYIVIAATDSPMVNKKIYEESSKSGIMINIVDAPELCDFILPSFIKRGPLMITVTTDGESPALAKKIRKDIEKIYGEEYGAFTTLLGSLRERIQEEIPEEKSRKKFWEILLESNIPQLLKERKKEDVEEIIEKASYSIKEMSI